MRYGNREDFDYSWIFVYASYSYDRNAARFWAFFTNSGAVGSTSWDNNNKRWPVSSMKFKIGGSHPNE